MAMIKKDSVSFSIEPIPIEELCRKRQVIAVLMTKAGNVFIGGNRITSPQSECPRHLRGLKNGKGWELCKEICGQIAHAEVDALNQAGDKARGGHLYLIGHHIACDDCTQKMTGAEVTHEIIAERYDELILDKLLNRLLSPESSAI